MTSCERAHLRTRPTTRTTSSSTQYYTDPYQSRLVRSRLHKIIRTYNENMAATYVINICQNTRNIVNICNHNMNISSYIISFTTCPPTTLVKGAAVVWLLGTALVQPEIHTCKIGPFIILYTIFQLSHQVTSIGLASCTWPYQHFSNTKDVR